MDIKKVNLQNSADNISELFEYLEVGKLNDHVLNIIKAENRTLDFHVHDESDEMFYVIDGNMHIEFTDQIIGLKKGDFLIVPKGTKHRPLCKEPVTVLLVEKSGTLNNENTGGTYNN